MAPIDARCSRRFHAAHTSGRRDLDVVRWIVMHDSETATAKSAAEWFANPQSQGSAHLCVGDVDCYRLLDNDEIPWAAPGANVAGFHIEQAGFARWSAAVWTRHRKTLERAAYKAALHCHVFGIAPRFVPAARLTRGDDGITTHAECSKAFGGSHSDPGPFWPRRLFMSYVRGYYGELGV